MTDKNATPATLKTSHLAKRFNMKTTTLRRILRSMPEYADGVFTRYSWDAKKDAAKIDAIAKRIKAIEISREEARKQALAALSPVKPTGK